MVNKYVHIFMYLCMLLLVLVRSFLIEIKGIFWYAVKKINKTLELLRGVLNLTFELHVRDRGREEGDGNGNLFARDATRSILESPRLIDVHGVVARETYVRGIA